MRTIPPCCPTIVGALLIAMAPTIAAATPPATSADDAARFVASWMALWNGDIERVEQLIAPDVRLHATMFDGSDSAAIDSPEAFAAWIEASRTIFPDLVFTPVVGPMIASTHGDDVSIAVHWEANGTYVGGFPGAGVPVGTRVGFTGTDVVRLDGGRVAEYWLVTDTLALFDELGIQ